MPKFAVSSVISTAIGRERDPLPTMRGVFTTPENSKPFESVNFVEGYEKKMPGIKAFDQTKDFKDGNFLYRVESADTLQPKFLKSLFHHYKIIKSHTWDFAYPSLPTMKASKIMKFQLNKGLYFPSAMEFTASCMEMQTIAAKNVVKMIARNEGAVVGLKSVAALPVPAS